MRKRLLIIGLIILAGFGGLVTFAVSRYGTPEKFTLTSLNEAWGIIQWKYVDQPVPDTLLFYGAIENMVRVFDDSTLRFTRPNRIQKGDEIKIFELSKKLGAKDIMNGWKIVKSFYPERDFAYRKGLPDTLLLKSALKGMFIGLDDPYSCYLDPGQNSRQAKIFEKARIGIGITFVFDSTYGVVVTDVFPVSPAERAGIRRGDIIFAVDGDSAFSLEKFKDLTKRASGEEVSLIVKRKDLKKEIKVICGEFEIPFLSWKMINDIAYIRLWTFYIQDINVAFRKEIKQVLERNPRAIVLDMRNNPGGNIGETLLILSQWLGKKVTTKTIDQKGWEHKIRPPILDRQRKPYLSWWKPRLEDIPTVVLVDSLTASGAEITAAALRYYSEAIIVGETTYGKGVGQEIWKLSCGGTIVVTSFKWYTPDGESIHGKGVVPDIIVKDAGIEDIIADRDPQLERAVEMLNGDIDALKREFLPEKKDVQENDSLLGKLIKFWFGK